jgi:hypothetical protein
VGRAESARDEQQVVFEAVTQRSLELGRRVADDPELRRFDPSRVELPGEERAVQVGTVAPNELGTRDDDRGARGQMLRRRASAIRSASP